MISARERFRQICRFERVRDPFFWSVHAWNETLDRWVREGMPVSDLDNRFINEVRKLSAYPETRRLIGERI